MNTAGYRVLGSEREVQGGKANFVFCSVLPRVLGHQHTTAKHHDSCLLVEGLTSHLKPTSLIFPQFKLIGFGQLPYLEKGRKSRRKKGTEMHPSTIFWVSRYPLLEDTFCPLSSYSHVYSGNRPLSLLLPLFTKSGLAEDCCGMTFMDTPLKTVTGQYL